MNIYRHFKGNYYRLVEVAKSSEDMSELVIYKALYGDCETWIRPFSMWNEIIERDGKKFKRFEPVDVSSLEVVDRIAWIYIKDGKVLSTKSNKGRGIYCFPGGKRENKESDIECLEREIQEELDIKINKKSASLYGKYYAQHHNRVEGVLIKETCYKADFKGDLKPSREIEEMAWLSYGDRAKVSPVDKIIMDELFQKGLVNQ